MDYGLIVDLETTGLDAENDSIIEIGLLEFAVETGKDPVITKMYGSLEDPGCEITAEITKITGIENSHVKNQKIDWPLVQGYFDRASIAIAHNMAFDRSFLKKRSELDLGDTHWACSVKHIDWEAHGFKSKSLNYLAADQKFINPFAHRALFDCATTFRVISKYILELTENSYEKEILFSATGAPFEVKDKLRAHGYRWNPGDRVWQKTVFEKNVEAERAFLASSIYQGRKAVHTESEITLN